MMRRVTAIMAVGAGLGLLGTTNAQDLRDLRARNAAVHALEDIRRESLQNQIATSNAQEQARTQLQLRDLNAGVVTGPIVVRESGPRLSGDEGAKAGAEFDASMDRLERLTQDALAQSNARMRAIRPASEPKE